MEEEDIVVVAEILVECSRSIRLQGVGRVCCCVMLECYESLTVL